MDFHPYEIYAQTYTQKYPYLNTENSKKNGLQRDIDFFTTFDKYYFALKRLKTREFAKIQTFLGLKTAENVLMHKTCLTSQFLRLLLARFFREGKYAILRENLANKNLRNCDVRQVLCIKTFSAVFKPKNVCIFAKFSSFQSFQSEIILVKCCKEVNVPLKLVFFRIFRV